MIILAFDVGQKKTGIAIGNKISGEARPLAVVRGGRDAQLREIGKYIAEWKPGQLIVGMPLYADGTKHKMSESARGFGDSLALMFSLPVAFVDERFSTIAARAQQNKKPQQTKKTKQADIGIDATAAGIILQDWLDNNHHGGGNIG